MSQKRTKRTKTETLPINVHKIGNLNDIIKFINDLTTKNIEIVTPLDKAFSPFKRSLNPKDLNEFNTKLSDNEYFRKAKNIFQIQVKLKKGIEGSEIQLKLIECISVVQELQDIAKKQGLLDGVKRYDIISLKGALFEFIYMVEPMDNELLILSNDKTHLRKSAMAVFINASKLISLEASIHGKDPIRVFEDYIGKLSDEQQEQITRDYIFAEFKSEWLPFFSDTMIQSILDQIINNPTMTAKTDPPTLLKLFHKLIKGDRTQFLRLMGISLDGDELNTLRGISKEH